MGKTQRYDSGQSGTEKMNKSGCDRRQIKGSKGESSDTTSELMLEDFVIACLNEDINYLESALQFVLGADGYKYCDNNLTNKCAFSKEYIKTSVEKDELSIKERAKYYGVSIFDVIPYEGIVEGENIDIPSLIDEGKISIDGYQVELFHMYLMDNLIQRFDNYYYLPAETLAKRQNIGHFARRGYDFLLAITLYLELQLGVHIYFGKYSDDNSEWEAQRDFVARLSKHDKRSFLNNTKGI